MSALTDTVRIEPPRSRAVQSVKDSLVVARRNLIRMTRCIPGQRLGAGEWSVA
ncbi:hypothetical protein [Streptomyces sp. JW3]|uniref:hypothetical protein n=1 Tax=Streptomyces sp. JW3 TaxID=3456955 RepID=UPI003FA4C66F